MAAASTIPNIHQEIVRKNVSTPTRLSRYRSVQPFEVRAAGALLIIKRAIKRDKYDILASTS
jgi:hypothetical protein